MGRRFVAPALVLAAAIAMLLTSPIARADTSSQESSFVSRINAERTSRGLSSLSVRSDLVDVARRWSAAMAESGQISHDPNMPDEVSGWTALGDNVGRGPDVASIHDAFMRSDEHRSIILDGDYNQVGVGVVASGDVIYVTQVFVRRATASTPKQVTHRSAPAARTTRIVKQTGVATFVIELSDVIWEIDFGATPRTVTMLEQLVGLDAARVDPRTGAPR